MIHSALRCRRPTWQARTGRAKTPAALAIALCIFACGCAGYRSGTNSLYPTDVQTVYVPIFQSDSFRRDLSERITEAVVKEIELKTPYKVVATPNADSVLSGRVLNDTKRIIVEAPTDEPRETQLDFYVEVSWQDRQGAMLQQGQPIRVPAALVNINETANLVPEVGQSVASQQQVLIQRLAEQVVSLMEAPW